MSTIAKAAEAIKFSKHTIAFTGAGISVESGIPPFRGEGGIWSKYDPNILDLNTYFTNPAKSWPAIKDLFYDFFAGAQPNAAHLALSLMEKKGFLKEIITQNIDNLHQIAGNTIIHEFHGNSSHLMCFDCDFRISVEDYGIGDQPPHCNKCYGLLKPDFVFFGEGIPQDAYTNSLNAAQNSEVFIIIGTSGEVTPANLIPAQAKKNDAIIIEINTEPSHYTNSISDIFIAGKAGEVLTQILSHLNIE